MRCVIPSVSKVSLANIILLTLFVGSCFGLSFVLPFALHESHLRLKNCLSQPFFAFQKVAITLNETFRDHTIILFEPHSLRHYWSRNHGAIVASMKQKFFSRSVGTILLPSIAPFKYLFFSTWVPFLLSFTIILQ